MKTFIGEWMEHLNYTPEKLGDATGISPKIIARWLKEETTPSVLQLDVVSKVMGVTMDDLTRLNPFDAKGSSNSDKEPVSGNPIVTTMLDAWAKKFDVTADEIAAHTKLPAENIQKWIDKAASPSLMEATIIAASFGISVDDLMTKTPESFYTDYLDNHYFQTKNIKVAVRAQNWMCVHRIKNEIIVFKSKDSETFMIRYHRSSALEPIDIVRISLCRKYRDSREKSKEADRRYPRMEVVNVD